MIGKALALALPLSRSRCLPRSLPLPPCPRPRPACRSPSPTRRRAPSRATTTSRSSASRSTSRTRRSSGLTARTTRRSASMRGTATTPTPPTRSSRARRPARSAPSAEGYWGAAGVGALLPTGGTVNVSAYGARDLTNNFLVLLSPGYTTSARNRPPAAPPPEPLDRPGPPRDPDRALSTRSAATASLRKTVSDIVAVVERAYWNLVAARRDVVVREASVRLAAEQREDTKSRIDVGTLPESDIAQPIAELRAPARATSTRRRRRCAAPSSPSSS